MANAIATGAGGAVGGNAGAFEGYNVDRFNRQLHPDEKPLAKQLADKSDGKYTEAQIEDQMRIMGVNTDGTHQSGAPDTLVGQAPTDSGARWISAGTTADGQPILTQITAQANPELQSYILSNYATDVPGTVSYDPLSGSKSSTITGPFTKFDQSDVNFMRNTTADAASMVSNTAGWISSTAATGAAAPSPYTPVLGTIAFGSTVVGIGADAVSQLANPNVGQYSYEGAVALGAQVAGDRVPLASLVINGTAESVKKQPFSTAVERWISQQWGSIVNPNTNGAKK